MRGAIGAALALALAAGCASLRGGTPMTIIYLDSETGSDAASGRAPERAWKTLAKLESAGVPSDSRIVLASGRVFEGTLAVRNAAHVEVVTSGKVPAEIRAGTGDGLYVEGLFGFKASNLMLKGAGREEGNHQGRGIHLVNSKNVEIDRIDVSGFQRAGVEPRGCDGVSLTNVHAHENGHAGISAADSSDLYIGRCRAINNPGDPNVKNNHSGNGIVISGCSDAVVEYCEAAENGWDQFVGGQGNGPVGIWCHDSDHVTIQYCVAHHNKSTSGDGGGFDFDGGTSDSVLQYNYTYENQSSGMLLWEYGSRKRLTRNVVRYNIFVQDGEAGIRFGRSGGFDVEDIEIYHNLVISKGVPCVWGQHRPVVNVNLRNNVFIRLDGGEIVRDVGGVRYEGNAYWTPSGEFLADGRNSLAAWAKETGQESVDGKLVGIFADPLLASPLDTVVRITGMDERAHLQAYELLPGSPLVARGLDLNRTYAIDPGGQDFFGRSIGARGARTIGAHEPAAR